MFYNAPNASRILGTPHRSVIAAKTMRDLLIAIEPYVYRIATTFMLSLLDDPAILAMAFF